MIRYTDHAVDRFIEHWRPGMGYAEAEQTLRRLIAAAVCTRRNAIGSRARIHLAHTERGERICLVVRKGVVITVLDAHAFESHFFEGAAAPPDRGGGPEPARSPAEQRAALVASLLADRTQARREKAESIVAAWKAGRPVKRKTLRRAADVLGLRMGATPEPLLEPLDELVLAAAEGDDTAIVTLLLQLSPALHEVARQALGPEQEHEALDVFESFSLDLVDGRLRFPRIRGAAMPFLERCVRAAATRRKGGRAASGRAA